MKTIKIYKPQALSNSGSKGTASNPYTYEEFDRMVEAGTWNGGYVEGMGYVLPTVDVWASSDSFSDSDSDSDSWSDPWGSASDPWGSTEEDKPAPPSGGGGGGGGGTGGTGGGSTLSFPTPPSKINKGPGVRVYSDRLLKTKLSTLSYFTAVAYDENGRIMSQTKIEGYFLERVIDYDKATVSQSKTAILKGEYNIIPAVGGQKFHWYLQNVPGRYGVAIHGGNKYSDGDGCLLTGTSYSYNKTSDAYEVAYSQDMLKKLEGMFSTYGKGNITITITESF